MRNGNRVTWRAFVKHAASKALRAKAKRQLQQHDAVTPAKAKAVFKYHWVLSEE